MVATAQDKELPVETSDSRIDQPSRMPLNPKPEIGSGRYRRQSAWQSTLNFHEELPPATFYGLLGTSATTQTVS